MKGKIVTVALSYMGYASESLSLFMNSGYEPTAEDFWQTSRVKANFSARASTYFGICVSTHAKVPSLSWMD